MKHSKQYDIGLATEDFPNHVIIFRLTGHIACFIIGFCLN